MQLLTGIGKLVSQIRLSGVAEGHHLRVSNPGAWRLFSAAGTSSHTSADTPLDHQRAA